MSARNELRDCFFSDSRSRFESAADAYRSEVIAERDGQVIEWLGKKAGEFGRSNREARAAADAVVLMADKLSRGAVRDDETGVSELYRLRAENNQLRNDITGACLARYEEEQENVRLRLAWQSARERAQAYSEGNLRRIEDRDTWMGWAKEAQAEVQRLQAERHSTNEALSDAAVQLRVQRDRIAELEAAAGYPKPCGRELGTGQPCPDHPRPVPQQRQQEDPHDGPNHHDYALSRDLPFIPSQRDEEAL